MCSTRCRSSAQMPPGRHSSRKLQFAQVTSNFWVFFIGWMATTLAMAPSLFSGGALRDDVAHACELLALVEKIARAQPLRELAVGVGGEIGQHVEIDLGRLRTHGAQHVEPAAFPEADVEHHHVGPARENGADRVPGLPGLADDRGAGDRAEQVDDPVADQRGIFDDENLHAPSLRPRGPPPYRRRPILGVGGFRKYLAEANYVFGGVERSSRKWASST